MSLQKRMQENEQKSFSFVVYLDYKLVVGGKTLM